MEAIHEAIPSSELRVLLLAHSFSGSDTTSSIHGFGKVKILKKLASSKAPSDAVDTLVDLRANKRQIHDAGIEVFQYLYGKPSTPLSEQRFNKYNQLIVKGKLKPHMLPPTNSAAGQHSLRSYLQYRDWSLLKSHSLSPDQYGWTVSSGVF